MLPGWPSSGAARRVERRAIVSESQEHAGDEAGETRLADGETVAGQAGDDAAPGAAQPASDPLSDADEGIASVSDGDGAAAPAGEGEGAGAGEVEPAAVDGDGEPAAVDGEDEAAAVDGDGEPAAADGEDEPAAADGEDEAAAADGEDEPAEPKIDPVAEFTAELRRLPGEWYVVHSYAGYENRVKANLESRTQSLNMEDYIFQVEVPVHQVTEIKGGKRQQVSEKVLPGYILVRMDLTDESWAAVRNTPGVTGFVGLSSKPSPLSLAEVAALLAPEPEEPAAKAEVRRAAVEFEAGESVTVMDGPFATLPATVNRHPEAQGAGFDLRPGDPGRALLRSGLQDLTDPEL